MQKHRLLSWIAALVTFAGSSAFICTAHAQTDEIQVYDGTIAAPGVFNLTLHNNYTPKGDTNPAFPGGLVSNHSLNGVAEWAYGVNDWMEAGLYFPLYSLTSDGRVHYNGFKLRTLFVEPHVDQRSFFYGINFEYSFNQKQWEAHSFSSEIRPIVGWRYKSFDLIFNPILDTDWTGVKKLDFAPETRVDYRLNPLWTVAMESYDDYGPIGHAYSSQTQTHQLFGVVDYNGKPVNVEFGAGFGLNRASDHLTLKLILSRDL